MKEIQTPSKIEFVELGQSGGAAPDHLAIGSFGKAGSGKSRLIATMPGKVGVIPLDRKTRKTIEMVAVELGLPKGKILFPKEDFIRHANPLKVALMNVDEAMKYYKEHVKREREAIFYLAERKDVDSIGIDSNTQLSEDHLFSHFGRSQRIMPRDRGPYNQDLRDIFNSISHKHVVVTHQAKEIWKNDKPTGRYEWDGWSKLDYYVNTIVEHAHDSKKQEYSLTVRLSQDRPDLIGETVLENEDITFNMLATNIYPDWEFQD